MKPRYEGRTLAAWGENLRDLSAEVRLKAVDAVAHFGPRGVSLLVDALQDGQSEVRTASARRLGEMWGFFARRENTIPKGEVGKVVAAALGQMMVANLNKTWPDVEAAAVALAEMGAQSRSALPTLIQALTHYQGKSWSRTFFSRTV